MKTQCYTHRLYCCTKSVSYYYIIQTAIIFITVIVQKAANYKDWQNKKKAELYRTYESEL